jgi:hypothetical protein
VRLSATVVSACAAVASAARQVEASRVRIKIVFP